MDDPETTPPPEPTDAEILAFQRADGAGYKKVAAHFGVSYDRVQAVCRGTPLPLRSPRSDGTVAPGDTDGFHSRRASRKMPDAPPPDAEPAEVWSWSERRIIASVIRIMRTLDSDWATEDPRRAKDLALTLAILRDKFPRIVRVASDDLRRVDEDSPESRADEARRVSAAMGIDPDEDGEG